MIKLAQSVKTKQLKHQAFYVGELLVLDKYEREISYPGRKPDKWGEDEAFIKTSLTKSQLKRVPMLYRIFTKLADAAEFAEEVQNR